MRKKLVALLLVAAPVFAGCRASIPVYQPGTPGGGAVTAAAAAESFLAAARAQDIQALNLIWGTREGPALYTVPNETRERRAVVMLCHLRHDSHRLVDETSLLQGERRVTVEITRGDMTRRTNLTAVPANHGGWYVMAADLEPLRDICAERQQ